MGVNTSKADLEVYQSTINEVDQFVVNESENYTSQQIYSNQSIVLVNGSPSQDIDYCGDRIPSYLACIQSSCDNLDNGALYKNQILRGRTTGVSTVNSCDEAFGSTYETANNDTDGICSVGYSGDLTYLQRKNICDNYAIRLQCPGNPSDGLTNLVVDDSTISCGETPDCPPGTFCGSDQVCGTKVVGGFISDPTCGVESPGKVFYTIHYKNSDGNIAIDYKNISTPPQDTPRCTPFELEPNTSCYTPIFYNDYFECILWREQGSFYDKDSKELIDGYEQCSNICSSTLLCSETDKELYKSDGGLIECAGGLELSNDSALFSMSDQATSSFVEAEMVTSLTNRFQSDISKRISQTNEDLNFGQQNKSQERTIVTQQIKNTVLQSLSASARNNTSQIVDGKQEITVYNYGTIRAGRGEGSSCMDNEGNSVSCDTDFENSDGKCLISNKATVQIESKNRAETVVNAVMNSNITNDLLSKYEYELTQKNKGINILDFLGLIILGIIVVIVAFIFASRSVIKVFEALAKNKFFWAFLIILIIVLVVVGVYTGYFGVKKSNEKEYPNANEPPEEIPTPGNPDYTLEGEFECTLTNVIGNTDCKAFVKLTEEDPDPDLCNTYVSSLETDPDLTKELQCSSLVDRGLFINGTLLTQEQCIDSQALNYVENGHRLYCPS